MEMDEIPSADPENDGNAYKTCRFCTSRPWNILKIPQNLGKASNSLLFPLFRAPQNGLNSRFGWIPNEKSLHSLYIL